MVEELIEYGRPFNLGLEAGSKPELLVALALQENPEALILCNGYKDRALHRDRAAGPEARAQGHHRHGPHGRAGDDPRRLAASSTSRPIIGVRARLSTKGAGKWVESTGDRSKFGLTTAEIVDDGRAAARARACSTACSSCTSTSARRSRPSAPIKDALREASRIFVELHALGANMRYLDCGGGLGRRLRRQPDQLPLLGELHAAGVRVRHRQPGGRGLQRARACRTPTSSPSPAAPSPRTTRCWCSTCSTPTRCSLGQIPESLAKDEHRVIQQLYETYEGVSRKNFQEAYHDALQLKEEAITAFNLGVLDLKARARVEQLFYATCEKILKIVRDLSYVPDELEGLEKQLSDTYYCNFSLFQSLPDHWAVRQLFPTMPIHRLNKQPTRRGDPRRPHLRQRRQDGPVHRPARREALPRAAPARTASRTTSRASWSAPTRRSWATCTTCSATPTPSTSGSTATTTASSTWSRATRWPRCSPTCSTRRTTSSRACGARWRRRCARSA